MKRDDEQHQYGVRRLTPFDRAPETLEIEIRRALREVLDTVRDNDEVPDWDSFELCVKPAWKDDPLFTPARFLLETRIYTRGKK